MTATLAVVNVSLLLLLAGVVWAAVRLYEPTLSSIEQQLHAITTVLGQVPRESVVRKLLLPHEQRLRGITEQLHSRPDAELLHRYLQDQTDQLLAIISTCESGAKPQPMHADIETSLRLINENLERVLWALRFDEERYQERAAPEVTAEPKNVRSQIRGKENTQDPAGPGEVSRDDPNAAMLANSLQEGGDSYQAMLDYMRSTGKGGTDALQALEMARVMHSR